MVVQSHVCNPPNVYKHLLHLITGRNEVVAKVMFLHVSVILLMGGSPEKPPQDQATTPLGPGNHPPWDQATTPLGPGNPPCATRQTPPGPRRTPPGTRQTPPSGRTLQHTVNEQPVCILLECILVMSTCAMLLWKNSRKIKKMVFFMGKDYFS